MKKTTNMLIKPTATVSKPNPLLMMKNDLSIMQTRFLNCYLSKINVWDESTYSVRISLKEFCNMLSVDAKNLQGLIDATDGLLSTRFDFIDYVNRFGDKKDIGNLLYKKANLFTQFTINGNRHNGYVEIEPSSCLIAMFKEYVKYGYVLFDLKSSLNLSTVTFMRFYEFLIKYKNRGTVQIHTELLKQYMGLSVDSYSETKLFNYKILKPSIREINQKTNVNVSFEPMKQGRKVIGYKFTVVSKDNVYNESKNIKYI